MGVMVSCHDNATYGLLYARPLHAISTPSPQSTNRPYRGSTSKRIVGTTADADNTKETTETQVQHTHVHVMLEIVEQKEANW